MKIYVASSWRNSYQPGVVERLRQAGHEVYDFRNPPEKQTGFSWSDIDPNWMSWEPREYIAALDDPIAQEGYTSDRAGMDWAEVCVLVLPCGRSAHLEAGFMAGSGKPVICYMPQAVEPELMNLLLTRTVDSFSDLLNVLQTLRENPKPEEDG